MTRELELLVEAGLTPHEALQAATVTAGLAIGLPDRGQIAPGFRANMILIPGNPLHHISVIEHPSAVMIGGVWLDEPALANVSSTGHRNTLVLDNWSESHETTNI